MSGDLAAPGSSTYSSNTMHVGDGTWDSGRDSFLLPNLVGLNFETMRYNGMGNRFRNQPDYHKIITAHGIMAVITFLFAIPAAIFIARFYHQNGRRALRLHVWIQITVVLMATVILTLGWLAVGPKRSLTNPHHGIGLALYVLIIFQTLFGSLVHCIERKKERYKIPLKLFLHQWLGRAIALLGIIQVALGLTVYGSPKVLFILYAIWVFVLVLAYFILSYRHQTVMNIDDRGSYYSGTRTDITRSTSKSRKHGKLGTIAGGLGLAAVATALGRRNRSRSRSRSRSRTRLDAAGSRRSSRHSHHDSGSYLTEKYSDEGRKDHTWRDRLLAGGAAVGALAAARKLFGGRKHDTDTSSSVSDYPHHALGGAHSITNTDMSRVEEGRVPVTPTRPGRAEGLTAVPAAMTSPSRHSRVRPRRSGDSINSSYDSRSSYYSPGQAKKKDHTVRNTLATLGVAGYLKHKFNDRRTKKEDARVEEVTGADRRYNKLHRHSNSGTPLTGDGRLGRHRRHSLTDSELTPLGGSNPELSLNNLRRPSRTAGGNVPGSRTNITAANTAANTLVPPPPLGASGVIHDSSGSEAYTSAGGNRRHRHRRGEGAAAAAALGAAAGATAADHRSSSRRRASNASGVNSPPVSVKVKMHNDGRHVTLRRLDAAEAAAEREARRRQRGGRSGSISSVGGSGDEHWRRVERREQEQAAALAAEQQHNIPASLPGPPPGPPPPPSNFAPPPRPMPPVDMSDLPPPPPIGSAVGGGSPGSLYGSGPSAVDSRAESNRRRRRAERARMEAQRRQGGGRVEFE